MANNTHAAINQIVSDSAALIHQAFVNVSRDLNEMAETIELETAADPSLDIVVQMYRDAAAARIADADTFQAWIKAGKP